MWKAPQDRALWGSEPWGPAWTGPGDICELAGEGGINRDRGWEAVAGVRKGSRHLSGCFRGTAW